MNKRHTKHMLLIYEVGWERDSIDISSLGYEQNVWMKYNGWVKAKLNSYDSHTQEIMRSIHIESRKIGCAPIDCIRKAVEAFMNGDLYDRSVEFNLYHGPCKMDDNWGKWDVSITLDEPWKSMFLKLFDTKSNLLIKSLKGYEANQI